MTKYATSYIINKPNPKGSRANTINDYRSINARKVNCIKFPDSSFYIMKIEGMDLWKLGVSQNIDRRLRDINNSMPFSVSVIYSQKIKNAYLFEENIHHKYENSFVQNEWFSLNEDDVVEIIVDCKLWQGQ